MRSQLIGKRLRSTSLSTVPPSQTSEDYSADLADIAAHVLYRSPLPSESDLPIFILNAAALPDAKDNSYDTLLPYILARLPDEQELIGGKGYELICFASGEDGGATNTKKERPGWGFLLQAYHVLTRAMRKRLQKLYLVHERTWIRLMVEAFSTIVSPKFRKKIIHVSCLSALALYIPIENLLIPPSAYLYDRRGSSDIHAPYVSGRRAFGVMMPLPISSAGTPRLPRVLREATSFVLMDQNIKTEGIFRVNARAVTVDVLKEAYNRGQKFIVWREGQCVSTFSHWKEGYGDVMVDDVEHTEGFGLFPAAGLIKRWYAELRQPVFPEPCYSQLEWLFGEGRNPIEVSSLRDLICVDAEWSLLSKTSRQIIYMHLLPLLSRVAEYQDWNQMTPYNLAVCFAPNLVCGRDPTTDARMAGVVRRILEAAIMHWKSELSTSCGMDHWQFEESLRAPESREDREDPQEEIKSTLPPNQVAGIITLVDNEDITEESLDSRPPLPPRPDITLLTAMDGNTPLRRKPAPSVQAPPRYSTLILQSPVGTNWLPTQAGSPVEYSTMDAYGIRDFTDATSGSTQATVSRKPLPENTKTT